MVKGIFLLPIFTFFDNSFDLESSKFTSWIIRNSLDVTPVGYLLVLLVL